MKIEPQVFILDSLNMQLRLHCKDLKVLDNIESILYSNDRKIGKWFMENLPGEVYEQLSPQYELQVLSGMQIRKLLGGSIFKNIKGFYFGSDQCEFLVPSLTETKKAIDKTIQFDKKYVTKDLKQFVFLTPYYGHSKIRERLINNFEYLNKNAKHINKKTKKVEVVINDWGTLKLLKKYDNLKPVLGRLLVKTLKLPLVDTFGLNDNVHVPGKDLKNADSQEIQEQKDQIAKSQKDGLDSSALGNEFFQKFLNKQNIKRAGIDYLKDKKDLYTNINDSLLDIYYPYGLVAVGRLCDTAGIEDIKKAYYPTEKVCPRTCRKYDLFVKNFDTVGYKLFQRGNAQYKSQLELELPDSTVNEYDNRLIYSMFV